MDIKVAKAMADRLKERAKVLGCDTQTMLQRYAMEGFLRRLTMSGHADRFALKGGLLFLSQGDFNRPTEDIDFHSVDPDMDEAEVERILRDIAAIDLDDGMEYSCGNYRSEMIREGFIPGIKVAFDAALGMSPIRMRFDVCRGDAVVGGLVYREIAPCLPKHHEPVRIAAYPWETVIAEKLHAITEFGLGGTRYKDWYDLCALSRTTEIDGDLAVRSVIAAFGQRGTEIEDNPVGLTEAFADARCSEFKAWQKKKGPFRHEVGDLYNCVEEAARFAWPILDAAKRGVALDAVWIPGMGWQDRTNENSMNCK